MRKERRTSEREEARVEQQRGNKEREVSSRSTLAPPHTDPYSLLGRLGASAPASEPRVRGRKIKGRKENDALLAADLFDLTGTSPVGRERAESAAGREGGRGGNREYLGISILL